MIPLLLFLAWTSSGPTGGVVRAVAVVPSNAAVVWAANSAGVFRSTDGGTTWADVSGPVVDVDFFVVHPGDANKAWALTGDFSLTHVYRTADGGATWLDSTDGLGELRPTAFLIDPRNPDTLYIGSTCEQLFGGPPAAPQSVGGPGVFKSTDGGATWQASFGGGNPYANCAEEMAIDPFSPWRLFFAGQFHESGITESYDGGKAWERADGPRPTRAVVFDARYPFTHYGISSRIDPAVFVSQDGGFTWKLVGAPPPSTPLSLSMDPERSRIFLGASNGVWRSGNRGTVWAPTSLQTPTVLALDFGGVPASLFAATFDGLYRLTNRGLGDARLIDLHDRSSNVVGIAVDPSDSNVVYAGVQLPFNGNITQPRSRVFRSTNGGASWERLPGDTDAAKADHLTVGAGGTLYAGAGVGPLYRRSDTAWTIVHGGNVFDVAADPKAAGTLFLSTSSNVLRSRDGGATWSSVLSVFGHIAIDPSDPRWIYVGNQSEFFRSSDGGDSWTTLAASGTDAIVVAPSNGAVLYRISQGLQRSDDRAATWRTLPLAARALAVDPRDENSIWASATNGALYHSTDGGASWQSVDGPFATARPAQLLVFDPTGHVLHAVYPSHGVWELATD